MNFNLRFAIAALGCFFASSAFGQSAILRFPRTEARLHLPTKAICSWCQVKVGMPDKSRFMKHMITKQSGVGMENKLLFLPTVMEILTSS